MIVISAGYSGGGGGDCGTVVCVKKTRAVLSVECCRLLTGGVVTVMCCAIGGLSMRFQAFWSV